MNRFAQYCGELADVGGSAGTHDVPPVSGTHRSVVTTDFPHDLVIRRNEGPGTDSWFRIPDWFIDSGVAFGLPAAQIKVLLLLLRIRDRSTGRSVIDISELCRRTELKLRTVQDALQRLLEHRAGLLAAHGSAIFEPFPGTRLAGRKPPDPPVAREPAQSTAQTRGNLRERAEICASDRGASEFNSSNSNQRKEKAAAAAAFSLDDSEEELAEVIAMLRREHLSSEDVERLAEKGLAVVSRIIAIANYLADRKELKSRRGFICKGVRDGYGMPEKLERRLVQQLKDKLRASGVADDVRAALNVLEVADATEIVYRGLLHAHEIVNLMPAALEGRLRTRLQRIGVWLADASSSSHFPRPHAGPSVDKAADRPAEGV